PRGEQLRPVLEDLIRWGLPLMAEQKPRDAVRSQWLAWALELMLADRQPDASPVTVELQTGDQPIVIETRDGTIRTRLGPADSVAATACSHGRATTVPHNLPTSQRSVPSSPLYSTSVSPCASRSSNVSSTCGTGPRSSRKATRSGRSKRTVSTVVAVKPVPTGVK